MTSVTTIQCLKSRHTYDLRETSSLSWVIPTQVGFFSYRAGVFLVFSQCRVFFKNNFERLISIDRLIFRYNISHWGFGMTSVTTIQCLKSRHTYDLRERQAYPGSFLHKYDSLVTVPAFLVFSQCRVILKSNFERFISY